MHNYTGCVLWHEIGPLKNIEKQEIENWNVGYTEVAIKFVTLNEMLYFLL